MKVVLLLTYLRLMCTAAQEKALSYRDDEVLLLLRVLLLLLLLLLLLTYLVMGDVYSGAGEGVVVPRRRGATRNDRHQPPSRSDASLRRHARTATARAERAYRVGGSRRQGESNAQHRRRFASRDRAQGRRKDGSGEEGSAHVYEAAAKRARQGGTGHQVGGAYLTLSLTGELSLIYA